LLYKGEALSLNPSPTKINTELSERLEQRKHLKKRIENILKLIKDIKKHY
jgi:hypothetical protein